MSSEHRCASVHWGTTHSPSKAQHRQWLYIRVWLQQPCSLWGKMALFLRHRPGMQGLHDQFTGWHLGRPVNLYPAAVSPATKQEACPLPASPGGCEVLLIGIQLARRADIVSAPDTNIAIANCGSRPWYQLRRVRGYILLWCLPSRSRRLGSILPALNECRKRCNLHELHPRNSNPSAL